MSIQYGFVCMRNIPTPCRQRFYVSQIYHTFAAICVMRSVQSSCYLNCLSVPQNVSILFHFMSFLLLKTITYIHSIIKCMNSVYCELCRPNFLRRIQKICDSVCVNSVCFSGVVCINTHVCMCSQNVCHGSMSEISHEICSPYMYIKPIKIPAFVGVQIEFSNDLHCYVCSLLICTRRPVNVSIILKGIYHKQIWREYGQVSPSEGYSYLPLFLFIGCVH